MNEGRFLSNGLPAPATPDGIFAPAAVPVHLPTIGMYVHSPAPPNTMPVPPHMMPPLPPADLKQIVKEVDERLKNVLAAFDQIIVEAKNHIKKKAHKLDEHLVQKVVGAGEAFERLVEKADESIKPVVPFLDNVREKAIEHIRESSKKADKLNERSQEVVDASKAIINEIKDTYLEFKGLVEQADESLKPVLSFLHKEIDKANNHIRDVLESANELEKRETQRFANAGRAMYQRNKRY